MAWFKADSVFGLMRLKVDFILAFEWNWRFRNSSGLAKG